MPKFVTSNGWLTEYALACGYLEVSKGYGTGCRIRARMEKDSACYHVRVFTKEFGQGQWDTYETLSEARNAFRQVLKENGLQRKIPVQPKD